MFSNSAVYLYRNFLYVILFCYRMIYIHVETLVNSMEDFILKF